jgi:hypothetical protein
LYPEAGGYQASAIELRGELADLHRQELSQHRFERNFRLEIDEQPRALQALIRCGDASCRIFRGASAIAGTRCRAGVRETHPDDEQRTPDD